MGLKDRKVMRESKVFRGLQVPGVHQESKGRKGYLGLQVFQDHPENQVLSVKKVNQEKTEMKVVKVNKDSKGILVL